LSHSLNSDFTVTSTGSFFTAAMPNTVEFKGSEHSNLSYSGALGYFRNILVNKGIGYSVTQVGNATCQNNGNLTVNQGYYFLNGNSLLVTGDINVNSAGYLNLSPSSLLTLTDTKSLNINAGGRLESLGTAANQANIRANLSTSHYNFNVLSGGTIAADYTTFKNMTINGVLIDAGATVDPAHAFKNCTFQDGTSAYATLLILNNSQVLTIRNANFPTNTAGTQYNVWKGASSGHVYFVDYTGSFSGSAFEYDPYNIVDWVPTLLSVPTATPAAICPGSSTQLNVTRTGGVGPYNYLWSPSTGLSNPTIINPVATPVATTTYSVTVTDGLGTTASGSILVTVNPVLPVSVTIAASANPSPPGNYVTFTATPVNGGLSPSYQWKVNGTNVGDGLYTYSYVPAYNDHVTCVVTSNYSCPSGNPATSNTITMIVVAANTTVTGNVPSPLNLCFNAYNTVTVAGGGNTFTVQSGARATMIAGVKISYLPGTTVLHGGYMHGYITATSAYCASLPPLMAAVVAGEEDAIAAGTLPESGTFAIYPNPTTGIFTILNKGDNITGKVQVDMFDMRGDRILSTSYKDEKRHVITLRDQAPGLYFLKIISGDQIESFKLIVTR
jgi:hypothetical protein